MRNHHEYPKIYLGESDYATLIIAGAGNDNLCQDLHFGIDGEYKAYLVDEDCEIPEFYEFIAKFENWMKIYDDHILVNLIHADEIKVYRAGDFGCIIQTKGYKK